MANHILRILAAAVTVHTAAAQTCGADGGSVGGGAVTDADCEGQTAGYHYNTASAAVTCTSAGGFCDLTDTNDMAACCEETMCDGNDVTAKDHVCGLGSKLIGAATTTAPGSDPEGNCCEPKVATDCGAAEAFCPTNAGTATEACITDCATCVGYANLPETVTGASGAYAADISGADDTCGESTCTANLAAAWAAHGIAIAGIAGDEDTVSELAGAVTTVAGYTRQAQTAGSTPAVATCGGTADDTTATPDCAAAFAAASDTLAASCPAGCDYEPIASITCELGTWNGGSPNTAFVVTPDATASVDAGGSANKCVLPAAAATGYDITGLTCGAATTSAGAVETTTGTINCATPHTCVAATHHSTPQGGTPGNALTNADITCPVHGAALDLANCAINNCAAGAPDTGYLADGTNALTATIVGDGVSGAVTGLGEVTCNRDPAGNGDGNYAETDDGYHGTAPSVSCADPTGTGLNPFTWSGCSQAKCNDMSGDGTGSTDPFIQGSGGGAAGECSTGMTLKTDLAVGCATDTCTTNDCCTDDDGCAPALGLNGVDDSGGGDDGQDPCLGTDSFCEDVAAPGVGNTCTCNDGFFGAVATSAADAAPVAGSCTACTTVANSAVDGTCAASGTTTCTNTVTCAAADNSRAVECITGAIHVDNTASGVSDVCRLECPFTDLVALIDLLHFTEDKCADVDLTTGTPSVQVQTAACEAVAGCYYIPEDLGNDGTVSGTGVNADVAASCAPIYPACKAIAQNAANTAADCGTDGAAGMSGHGTGRAHTIPTLSGDGDLTTDADNTAACTFSDGADTGVTTDDTCLFTPDATAYVPITRCDALLGTGWAHDLRDSCDASRACPLHGAAGGNPPGLVEMVKLVYSGAGVAPDLTGTNGVYSDGLQSNYFTDDAGTAPDGKSHWDVCTGIRDAVLAAPTCSSGSGR